MKAIEFITNNYMIIIIAILAVWEVVAALTPTEKDNSALLWVKNQLEKWLPSASKTGGVFVTETKVKTRKELRKENKN